MPYRICLNLSQGGIYICGAMKIGSGATVKLFHLYLEDSPAAPVDFLLCTFDDLAEYLNTDQPDKGAVERTTRHFDLYRHRVSKPLVNRGIP